MKWIKNHKLIFLSCTWMLLGIVSCNDSWNNYYAGNNQESENIEIYNGDIKTYISGRPELSTISGLFTNHNIYNGMKPDKEYTVIVTTNEILNTVSLPDEESYIKNCVSDVAVTPSKFTNGSGITTLLGKNIWINKKENGDIYLNDYKLEKLVKTSNGFLYYVNGIISVRPSIYEYFESLGDNYSVFKSLVKRYEETFFDPDKSTPVSVDAMGNTIYDTVMTTRNKLIDRYNEGGLKTWDMFSEDYLTTMFIPSNKLINDAIDTALSKIPVWLNRTATTADRKKFEEWIVRACFVNRRLPEEAVAPAAIKDIFCIDGYQQKLDPAQDVKTYEPADPAVWRPSVQKADINNQIKLSNGIAYYLTSFKIPNHIVIYRVKAKFYELWGAMTDAQKTKYFRWTNWIDPLIVNEAQSAFTLTATLPTMYYNVLTAIPSPQAIADSSVCSVTYDGVLYNSASAKKIAEVHLPAGEYNLRMGFKHSLRYSINIYFNNKLLVKDMLLAAQGSNFHFDRGSVSDLDYYGNSSIGFPEGFDWRDWIEKDVKAVAYDTDGYQVAVVNIPDDGNFTITISSNDDSYLYNPINGRTKNNVTQLMMYHWCLRPTLKNY